MRLSSNFYVIPKKSAQHELLRNSCGDDYLEFLDCSSILINDFLLLESQKKVRKPAEYLAD